MKALVGAFNQEKALVGAFSVIVQPVVELMDSFTALVLILIYESNITISNESGVASWWSAARTLFATFCPVIARCYYLYQRAKCFQHSQRRNCSSESGIECGCICSSSCLVTQSIECRDPAAR